MKRLFYKYHRILGILCCLPLALTVITGILYPIIKSLPFNTGILLGIVMRIHSGDIFHLQAVYSILNGLSLAALIVTGLGMTRLFNRKPKQVQSR
jgi:cellulose synthase/poly-beta-1,6-N-acetylglucosamine synthase-like glycosyltransferase